MHIRQYATMYPPICDLLAGFIHRETLHGIDNRPSVHQAICSTPIFLNKNLPVTLEDRFDDVIFVPTRHE